MTPRTSFDTARRRFLTQAGAAALLGVTGLPARAAEFRLPRPPVTPRVPLVRSQVGRSRTDSYAWLKYVPPEGQRSLETLPAPIREHLVAENAYAKAVLARVATEERAFFDAMQTRTPLGAAEPGLTRDGWVYATAYPDGSHPVYSRRRIGGSADETLLDEAARAKGHAYYRTTGQQVSPDGRFYAWAEDIGGNDRHRICVREITTGEVRVVVDTDAYGYGGVVFSPSSRYLFWIWRDARNRPTRVYRIPVTGGARVLVYEEADPAIFLQIERTAADGFVAINLSGPDTSEVRLIPATAEEAAPSLVWPRAKGRRYAIEEWNGGLVALIDDAEAPDGRIARVDRTGFAEHGDLVPHRPGIQILQMVSFRNSLARVERRDVLPRLVLTAPSGGEREVAIAGEAYALTVPAGQDHGAATCRAMIETPAEPPTWLDVDLASGRITVVARQRIAGFDPARFEVRRLFAPADDGEQVPITLLTRKGARADGSAPLLLYGYGAYGVSSEAVFDIAPTVLVERGWTYAIAHVRGGSEKGRRWFLDGRLHRKHNSFGDFVACARHLVATGNAARDKLVSYGLSAGGLLVGASMNAAPELWAGVIGSVPFVDMLNTMSDADHPLVPLFRPDWGDPLSSAEDYDYMATISPYENVKRAPYPPLLTTAGLKDDRVGYWEPAKLVAEVRAQSTSASPAMLLTDMTAGHQGSGGRDDQNRKMARFYAFAQGCVEGRFA
ncbi:S9 family peptidase [Sphingomonas desiccabilis]|uniref:S9 family peptidase n=1 Tax=Sphingomonas desiccabilis TaxID=429134 RepID=A0A4Q2IQ22_9SPHN|nr:prolyl oligopeptidase family serine peptidase [Sphingomonas desiccabilis]MBB3912581.1 oligopeptidase B [Sphingomonas desiccabilis]RXZ29874.1 S9 family peptidase [Sphingomonas desiccabilis]